VPEALTTIRLMRRLNLRFFEGITIALVGYEKGNPYIIIMGEALTDSILAMKENLKDKRRTIPASKRRPKA
jgi:hypothetical protein